MAGFPTDSPSVLIYICLIVYNTDEDHTARDRHNLNYHLVWLPKYRNSVLVNEVADRVRTILHEIADDKGPRNT